MKPRDFFVNTQIKRRNLDDNKGVVLTGLCIPYNTDSQLMYNTFFERIAPNAFKRTIAEKEYDVVATIDHNPEKMLGRLGANTLKLFHQDDGVYFENTIPNTSYANDLLALIETGDLKGMSFTFTNKQENEVWEQRGEFRVCTILEATLKEITYTYNPCYQDTNVGRLRDMQSVEDYRKRADNFNYMNYAERIATLLSLASDDM